MATFDECMEKLPEDVQAHINAIIDAAGTFDADFAVLLAAGERCVGIIDSMSSDHATLGAHNLIPSYQAQISQLEAECKRLRQELEKYHQSQARIQERINDNDN